MLFSRLLIFFKITFLKKKFFQGYKCDQLTETGRVRQSAVIHCQIRLVYSKSGVIAYVRFTRATN